MDSEILIFCLISISLVLIIIIFWQLYLPHRTVTWYPRVAALLGWTLALAMPVTTTLDIYTALTVAQEPLHWAYVTVTTLYWVVIGYTWLVFTPYVHYASQGHSTLKHRVIGALTFLGSLYGIIGVCALPLVIYILCKTPITVKVLYGLALSFSSAYGVVITCTALSFGLVHVPRALAFASTPRATFDHAAGAATNKRKRLLKLLQTLDDLTDRIEAATPLVPPAQQAWARALLDRRPAGLGSAKGAAYRLGGRSASGSGSCPGVAPPPTLLPPATPKAIPATGTEKWKQLLEEDQDTPTPAPPPAPHTPLLQRRRGSVPARKVAATARNDARMHPVKFHLHGLVLGSPFDVLCTRYVRTLERACRQEAGYQRAVDRAHLALDLIESTDYASYHEMRVAAGAEVGGGANVVDRLIVGLELSKVTYGWRRWLRGPMSLVFCAISILLTLVYLVSEVMIIFGAEHLTPIAYYMRAVSRSPLALSLALLYPLICLVFSLTTLQFTRLQPAPGATYGPGLVYHATYVARYTLPLMWNLATLSGAGGRTALGRMMDYAHTIPVIGLGFTKWWPVTMVLIVLIVSAQSVFRFSWLEWLQDDGAGTKTEDRDIRDVIETRRNA